MSFRQSRSSHLLLKETFHKSTIMSIRFPRTRFSSFIYLFYFDLFYFYLDNLETI